MVKYTIHYFNGRGRAELARLLASAGGLDWEDKRYTKEEWPTVKPNTPTGQLPYMTTDDGRELPQSIAIARFLAAEAKLLPEDNFKRAKADALIDTFWDVNMHMVKAKFMAKTDEEKAECMKAFGESLARLLAKVEEKCGDQEWFFDTMTWVDIAFFDCWGWWAAGAKEVTDKHPKLQARVDRVAAVPAIKAWLDKRPASEF